MPSISKKRLREIIAEELAYRFALDEGLWDDPRLVEGTKKSLEEVMSADERGDSPSKA